MDRARSRYGGQANVFKGSQLVTSVLERYPGHLTDRKAALQFCRQLFKEGTIRGVFGVDSFEDSVLLYTWNEKHEPQIKPERKMTSQSYMKSRAGYGYSSADTRVTKRDLYNQADIKPEVEPTQSSQYQSYTRLPTDSYFVGNVHVSNAPEVDHSPRKPASHYRSSPNYKRASTASSESSVEITSRSYLRNKDKNHHPKPPFGFTAMTLPHDHDVIPEEVTEDHHVPLMERTGTSTEYDGSSSIPRSGTTDVSNYNDIDNSAHQRPWSDYHNSYSDNEKQLIEQMKRMKKEHSHILRTYEDRINKLMNKMHELRNIAQMLENSSTKSSPYGMLQAKPAYSTSGLRPDQIDRKSGGYYGPDGDPPPLPPRPGRGSRINPNKALVTPGTKMKPLDWTRIILRDKRTDDSSTIWHTMQEPTVDSEEVERLFSNPEVSDTDGATLYDDLIIRRGRARQQLVSLYDSERSKRIVICMKCLRATLTDVISTVSSLDTSQINHEGLAELFEFLSSSTHIEKTLHYVRRKGAGQLDHPEYLIFELSKVDHFTDRLEFMRFRYKTQWHLFEIEQQLRELNTACTELTNSISLKNLLETLLAVGNYLNGNTDYGQADGFALDVLSRLKDTQERDGKGTLLEFVLKTYCQIYESEVDIGCPTRFRLPEPSNMRHAAQVSFEGIQDALSNLLSDLRSVREKLLDQKARKDAIRPTDSFRVTAENFFAAALEVIGSQDKMLQDARDSFLRTVRFFQIDSTDVTPQQFFHIFAVFLHDCKYFWKLAHRRLAKERFELEFKFKGQLSAVDLHGYGSFRAGVIEGIYSTRPTDPKTSTLTKDEKSNKTRNEKMPVVPPKPSHTDLRKHHGDHIDHSPKPLTSTPPTSETLYKPLPQTPQTTNQNSQSILSPNYENQAELNSFYPRQHKDKHGKQNVNTPNTNDTRSHEQRLGAKDNSKDKKSQQYSLKMWLKKEREQVKREIDSDNNNETNTGNKKSNTSTRSFTRLKNSMIQRFSGGNSNKKDINTKDQNKENKSTKAKDNLPDFPEPAPELFESETAPSQFGSPRGYDQQQSIQYNSSRNRYLNGLDYDYNMSNTDVVISPIDDPDHEDIPSLPTVQTNTTEPFTDRPRLVDKDRVREQTHSYRVDPSSKVSSVPQYNTPIKLSHVSPNVHRHDGIVSSPAKTTNNYENQLAYPTHNDNHKDVNDDDANNNNGQGVISRLLPTTDRNEFTPPTSLYQAGNQPLYDRLDKRQGTNKYGTRSSLDTDGYLNNTAPTNPPHTDNEQFLTPGTREPMHIKSIGSLSDKCNALNNNPENHTPSRPMDTIRETRDTREGRTHRGTPHTATPTVRGDIPDTSPPLPPRTYTSHEAIKTARSDLQPIRDAHDQTNHMSAYDRLQNPPVTSTISQFSSPQTHVNQFSSPQTHVSQFSSPQTHISQFSTPQPFSRQTRSDSNIRPVGRYDPPSAIRHVNYPPYSHSGPQPYQQNGLGDSGRAGDQEPPMLHTPARQNEGEDKDEGYRAQLRRAANINPSAFTGYGSLKPNVSYTGRASLGPGYPSPSSTAVVKPTVMNSHEVSYMAF